jgi:hypothetical protein
MSKATDSPEGEELDFDEASVPFDISGFVAATNWSGESASQQRSGMPVVQCDHVAVRFISAPPRRLCAIAGLNRTSLSAARRGARRETASDELNSSMIGYMGMPALLGLHLLD